LDDYRINCHGFYALAGETRHFECFIGGGTLDGMLPPLSRLQVRTVDRLAVERYGMTSLVLMENAGRNAAEIIRREYGSVGRAIIFCGSGNNGGDGCVIARHLHNASWVVRLVMAGERSRLSPDAAANLGIVETMPISIVDAPDAALQRRAVSLITSDDVVVDALLGTGFSGTVRSPTDELIRALNDAERRSVVSIDVPSGLDCDTGAADSAAIRADWTITFVARKIGFDRSSAANYLGRVEVADIGAPRELVDEARAEAG